MKVLVAGASGFIGSHVAAHLRAAGHDVVALARRTDPASEEESIAGDFSVDTEARLWLPRLSGIDAVVNAVGILRESGSQSFAALHAAAPSALFSACAMAGVRKVIQISALDAQPDAPSRYHRSKAEADRHLAHLDLDWVVLKPSLVFGPGGASTRLFATLASGPWVLLPGDGLQRVQPVHVDDLAQLCVRLLATARFDRCEIAVVGPQPYTVRGLLAEMRLGMGLGEPRFVAVPMPLVRHFAVVARYHPRSALDPETLAMLEQGNAAPASGIAAVLGRDPRPVLPLAITPCRHRPGAIADWARLNWLVPMLRWGIALMWIAAGVVSLGLYPLDQSYALLARAGITGAAAPVALFGAALLDLALGIALLVVRRRLVLWRLQIVLVLAYTATITLALPEYWLHPFGPVVKNVPLLAALVLLHELERRG